MRRLSVPAGVRRALGLALLAASLAFLADAVYSDWAALAFHVEQSWFWAAAGIGAAAYAALLTLLAAAWALVTLAAAPGAGEGPAATLWPLIRAYGVSNLLKYLPGNVFHYGARQAMGARAGLPHRALAAASVTELALHVAAALAVAGGFLLLDRAVLGQAPPVPAGVTLDTGLAGAAGLAAGLGLLALIGPLFRRQGDRTGRPMRVLAVAFACQAAFFAGSGLIAALCLAALPAGGFSLTAGAFFLIAWLAGFATPGAPGGVGVREAALVLLLPGPADLAVALALLTRLVSSLGDVLFAAAVSVPTPKRPSQPGRESGP